MRVQIGGFDLSSTPIAGSCDVAGGTDLDKVKNHPNTSIILPLEGGKSLRSCISAHNTVQKNEARRYTRF